VSSSISSSDDRSARRFAIAFLVVFLAGAAIFVAGSEVLVRTVVAPADGFERYRIQFRAAKAPIAAFGDSHVENAIASAPEIVNLGYPAETLPLMLFKANMLVQERRAEAVILQLSPQQFANYRAENSQDEFRDELLAKAEPLLYFTRPHFRRYLLAHWQVMLTRWTRSATAEEARPPATPRRSFADWPAAEQRRSAEIRVQLHAPLSGGAVTDRLLASLRDTLAGFREHQVSACIVRYPVSGAYRKAAAALPSFAILSARVMKLAQEQGAVFVDLHDALPDDLLTDPDHVGAQGRALATAVVVQRCFGRRIRPS
jgi:hypothetical protein